MNLTPHSDHPLRQSLSDELHGRPGQPITAPARILHLAFVTAEGDGDPRAALAALCERLNVSPPGGNNLHHTIMLKDGRLRFERHGEFYRLSLVTAGKPRASPFPPSLPADWARDLPGRRLVSMVTDILPKTVKAPGEAQMIRHFGHDDLAASRVNDGRALVITDFRIGPDGHTHVVIYDRGLAPRRMGRLVRRLQEIETYRMMALLALPVARSLQKDLAPLEQSLITTMVGGAAAAEQEQLETLSKIARGVETMCNLSTFRFAATRAYAALVAQRLKELEDERISDFPRISVFFARRFDPAMKTCEAAAARIDDLAERAERASNLLRTRVDIALEHQNQQLLRSMETRARQQLMLQETVEGLSVVAISYYLYGIVSKFAAGLSEYLTGHAIKEIDLILIPAVVLVVWLALRAMKKRIHAAARHD